MNKLFKNFVLTATIAGLSTVALTGCTNNSNNNETSGTQATTEAAGNEPATTQGQATNSKYSVAVAGSSEMNGVFSPFFGVTTPDRYGYMYVVDSLLGLDRQGSFIPNIADFNIEEIKDDAGNTANTVYTFTLKEGIKFSDGEPVTADDIIFSYKVYCDPNYDGSATIYTTPIVGVNEYRYDDPDYASKIEQIKAESQNITDDEVNQLIIDTCNADYDSVGADEIVSYIGGLDGLDGLDDAAKKQTVVNAYIEYEKANKFDDYKETAVSNKYTKLEKEYIQSNLAGGNINVPEIEGIKKIDDRTVQVTVEGVDPKAIDNLGGSGIAPVHYYGVGKDGTKFTKGNLEVVKEKNGAPMGSGPYVFEKFENNVVTLRANENYFLGTPKTPSIKFQVTSNANLLEAVKTGDIDISQPDSTPEMLQDTEDSGLHAELVDNLGYGYIGINAERVPDKNVRKGLMHLMNRKPAVETAYGDLASIIERPMSKVSWAYPQDATEYYGFDTAKALEYFKAAGYEQVDGKLMKDGKQLEVEVGIGASGTMDHPSAPILTQMKTEMEKLGGILNITDVDWAVFSDRQHADGWDIWVAAWSAIPDPDMYQLYHSEGPTNYYKVKNSELDKLIIDARQTLNQDERKEIYSKALDIIMDEAVEMPVYQRKNMTVFNPEIIDTNSLPTDPSPFYTPFYQYSGSVHTLQLK